MLNGCHLPAAKMLGADVAQSLATTECPEILHPETSAWGWIVLWGSPGRPTLPGKTPSDFI
jgi:hypothetical protein